MFTKTVLVASTFATASAATAKLPPMGENVPATKSGVDANVKTVEIASSVDSSSILTSGAWGYIVDVDCANPDLTPTMYGYVLNECRGTSSAYSIKYTGCEWVGSGGTQLVTYYTTYTAGDCSGTGTSSSTTRSGLTNGCDNISPDYRYVCESNYNPEAYGATQYIGYFDNGSCSGDEYYWQVFYYDFCNTDSSCTYSSSYLSTKGICVSAADDSFCFHVDTKIDYKGVEYTYEELKAGKEPECTVPHSPASKGVVISTSCDKTVRVTDTHLMATTKGFQLAYSLKAGDVLYGDYGKDMCTVKSVEKEKTTQQYFGLNCVHSEVLASGLRASTFGDFHTLPSWYMTYVGGLVGTETASSLGEYIAEWYFQK